MQHLQFDTKLPEHLSHPRLKMVRDPRRLGVLEWELDLLSRELILNAPERGKIAINSWNALAKATTHIKRIENETWGKFGGERNILLELNRISHRQFPWQNPINQPAVVRSFRIFSAEPVDRLIQAATGMRCSEIFPINLSLLGHFLRAPFIRHPIENELNSVPRETLNAFVRRFVWTFADLREHTKAAQTYDLNWAYTPNPLRDRPLFAVTVNGQGHYMCPVPTFLLRRLTDGLYYELVSNPAFGVAFGESFQKYIGDVIDAAVRLNPAEMEKLTEAEYHVGANRKDSIDWIWRDRSGSIFIECKAKRMIVQAKTDLMTTGAIDSELEKFAKFIAQTYRTLSDALKGNYPHWKHDGGPVFPLIVTLDDWFAFGPAILGPIDEMVRASLVAVNIDPNIVDRYPYTIASSEEFEIASQIIARRGIAKVLARRVVGEPKTWALGPYLNSFFPDDKELRVKMLFPETWRAIGPGGIV